MPKYWKVLVAIIATAFASSPALAATLHVPADFATIQTALDAASTGDVVEVAAGTFAGAISLRPGVILSGAGVGESYISGTVTGANGATLRGFSVSGSRAVDCGGATLLTIEDNHLVGVTHAIRCGGSATIRGNLLEGGQFTVLLAGHSELIENRLRGAWEAAVWAFSGSSLIQHNVINDLVGSAYGVKIAFSDSPTIFGNTFLVPPSSIGVLTVTGAPLIANNLFVGGWIGVRVSDSGEVSDTPPQLPTIVNNSFYGTRTGVNNGRPGSSVSVRHNVFWDIGFADLYEGGVVWLDGINGNLSADPLFVDPAARDYHLQLGSPCLDAGATDVAYVPATDADGMPRIGDADGDGIAVLDIGPFEGVAVPINDPPFAVAGPNQSIRVGDTVILDGSASFDDNTDSESLLYSWSFSLLPESSSATLENSDTAMPSFVADVEDTFVVQLTVTDEAGLSSTAQVTISGDNLAPTAKAGEDRLVIVGNAVDLNGIGSSDPEGDALSFAWSLTSAPVGSVVALYGADTATPMFTPDLAGVYSVTLEVSDFVGIGTPDTVTITAATTEYYAEVQILDAYADIEILAPDDVTTEGNQNAIQNLLTQAIVALQIDDIDEAIIKLEQAISRTNGCILRGSPDGNGQERDWITDCDAQEKAYILLTDALNALTL